MIFSEMFEADLAGVRRLVEAHPFALIVSRDGDRFQASPVPLLFEQDGEASYLLGHFARANPHVEALAKDGRALIVFLGAHGYISPSWVSDKTQAPTWNYETAHFEVAIVLDPTAEAARHAVERISRHMERGQQNRWTVADMGKRYERLVGGVIAFRAHINTARSKFKLGQNEPGEVLEEILAGLERTGQPALAMQMRAANRHRLKA